MEGGDTQYGVTDGQSVLQSPLPFVSTYLRTLSIKADAGASKLKVAMTKSSVAFASILVEDL